MISVLHITPHLGGGVGKALSSLVLESMKSGRQFHHVIVCLEQPEKAQFLDKIALYGAQVVICPSVFELNQLVSNADVVQLEWWNHPETIKCLCHLSHNSIRLIVWCHVSGLHNPVIPSKLVEASHKFLFTSPCSLKADNIASLCESQNSKLGVVSSGGGFDELPNPSPCIDSRISVGYIGSLNFSKLHPKFTTYLASVDLPDFEVRVIGEPINRDVLESQCIELGIGGRLNFRGYSANIVSELEKINVLAYLLNPMHYGTAENALLEAMAMGIVPIVLDNLAESSIVENFVNGFVVHSPEDFANTVKWLSENPEQRRGIGLQSAKLTREKYSAEKMYKAFCRFYEEILHQKKRKINFQKIFGTIPSEWFTSCQKNPEIFKQDGTVDLQGEKIFPYDFYEKTKGSVFHFEKYYPNSSLLKAWAKQIGSLNEI